MNTVRRVLLVGVGLLIAATPARGREDPPEKPEALTFDGASTELTQTVVVPTLETPLQAGLNAVWCASFAFAWQGLEREVLKGPVRLPAAGDLARRLTQTKLPTLPESALFHAAGRVTPTFLQELSDGMKLRFPGVPTPTFEAPDGALLAYAYLAARVPFRHPFLESEVPLRFGGTKVRSFGLQAEDTPYRDPRRQQVTSLYRANMGWGPSASAEFILDVDRGSKPFQLLLARIPRSGSLAQTLESLEERTKKRKPRHGLGPYDTLSIPEMRWRIDHRFRALEGTDKKLANPGFEGHWLARARQVIEFRLDKGGAALKSEADASYESSPAHYRFGQPFLVVMRTRDAKEPVLVAWVETPELLVPFGD